MVGQGAAQALSRLAGVSVHPVEVGHGQLAVITGFDIPFRSTFWKATL